MIRPFFVFLAPLGCVLMLAFTSLTAYRMMSLISVMMEPDARIGDVTVTSMAPIGALGAVMFGLGMMSLTLLKRKPSMIARMLLVSAALLMVVGAASNLCGDWLLMSAFRNLATAEVVDAQAFADDFRSAKIPMLAGYAVLLVASISVAAAASMMESKARRARGAVTIGMLSFAFLLLMVYWGQTSIAPFPELLQGDSIEPSSVAGSMTGVLRADFLSQGSMLGFALATLLVAVAGRKEPALD